MIPAVSSRRRLPANRPCPPPRVKLQKVKKNTIGAFEKEQVLQLLAAPNQRTYLGFRDYVLLALLFDSGLRINEALNLTVDDLNLAERTITVRASVAKNGTSRVVPVSKRTAELLSALVQENLSQYSKRSTSNLFKGKAAFCCLCRRLRGSVNAWLYVKGLSLFTADLLP